jgi:hypothetical protein
MMSSPLAEKHDRLWWVAAAPAIWGAHFVLSYGTVAVWCAKQVTPGGPLGSARVAVFVYSALALLAVLGVALRGLGQYRRATPPEPGDDSREGRHHFIGFTLLALSGLSALAIVYEALTVVFIGSCR